MVSVEEYAGIIGREFAFLERDWGFSRRVKEEFQTAFIYYQRGNVTISFCLGAPEFSSEMAVRIAGEEADIEGWLFRKYGADGLFPEQGEKVARHVAGAKKLLQLCLPDLVSKSDAVLVRYWTALKCEERKKKKTAAGLMAAFEAYFAKIGNLFPARIVAYHHRPCGSKIRLEVVSDAQGHQWISIDALASCLRRGMFFRCIRLHEGRDSGAEVRRALEWLCGKNIYGISIESNEGCLEIWLALDEDRRIVINVPLSEKMLLSGYIAVSGVGAVWS